MYVYTHIYIYIYVYVSLAAAFLQLAKPVSGSSGFERPSLRTMSSKSARAYSEFDIIVMIATEIPLLLLLLLLPLLLLLLLLIIIMIIIIMILILVIIIMAAHSHMRDGGSRILGTGRVLGAGRAHVLHTATCNLQPLSSSLALSLSLSLFPCAWLLRSGAWLLCYRCL